MAEADYKSRLKHGKVTNVVSLQYFVVAVALWVWGAGKPTSRWWLAAVAVAVEHSGSKVSQKKAKMKTEGLKYELWGFLYMF